MNAMSPMRFDIQELTEVCTKHRITMSKYRGRVFCKQCEDEVLKRGWNEHSSTLIQTVREKHFCGAKLPARHAQSGFKEYIAANNGQQNAKQQCVRAVPAQEKLTWHAPWPAMFWKPVNMRAMSLLRTWQMKLRMHGPRLMTVKRVRFFVLLTATC